MPKSNLFHYYSVFSYQPFSDENIKTFFTKGGKQVMKDFFKSTKPVPPSLQKVDVQIDPVKLFMTSLKGVSKKGFHIVEYFAPTKAKRNRDIRSLNQYFKEMKTKYPDFHGIVFTKEQIPSN